MSYAIRPDSEIKARGAARYGTDLERSGMLWGALVLAPVAHGTIRSIDLSAARAMSGVVAIASADLPSLLADATPDAERPVFPSQEIVYRHQPVAAIAAPTLSLARAAARAVKVDATPLPMVESIEEGAMPAPEVIAHVHSRHGDVERAFAGADLVLTEVYRTAGIAQVPLEPHAVLAEFRSDGVGHVLTSTQSPFGAREDIASILGIPEDRVIVEGTWVGGGFGGKGSALLEPYALLLAKASGRPVRLALSYREEFLLGRTTLPTFVRISSAVKEGRIVGRRVLWRLDAGASLPGRDFATGYCIGFIAGPYRIPAIELEGYALRTHKPPLGPHRAPLAPQCAFVAESHMDHLAARLGVDSTAFRRDHAWVEGDRTHLGQSVGSFGLAECLARAERLALEWRRARAPGHGVGVGAGFWSTGTGSGGEARLVLSADHLTIVEGEREIGSASVVRGIAAVAEKVLGLPRHRIEVEYLDTSRAPFDSGVWGSRTVGALGQAVKQAALALRAELARRSSGPEKEVRLNEVDGELSVTFGATSVPVRALLRPADQPVGGILSEGRHYGKSGEIDLARVIDGTFYPYTDFTGAAHVAEVAVDVETGSIRVLRYAAFHDIGTVVDRATARAQVEGGVVMGLGTALTEETMWNAEGLLLNPHLLDYRIPTLGEVPPIDVTFVEGFLGAGPFGAKGLGEPPIVPVPATIANAVRDATGIGPTEIPMTGERMARALKVR
ncbi:MAG: xanthine dehydrogenase family protein molybdopterin-binding subunit [Thermoplasmata archaeon]